MLQCTMPGRKSYVLCRIKLLGVEEYVYKCKEMFMSFLIDEKTLRITMHIVDYGPLGDGKGAGEQIEFWTESQVETIPKFLSSIKDAYSKMK